MKPLLVQRRTRICLYKTLQDLFCYGREAWKMRKKDFRRMTANDMKFMRCTTGYTKWDHKHNNDIMDKLQLEPIINYI